MSPLTNDGVSSLCNLSNPPPEDFTPVVQLIDLQIFFLLQTNLFVMCGG